MKEGKGIMRRAPVRRTHAWAVAVMAAAITTGACGGSAPKTTKTPSASNAGVAGTPVSNAQGQQLGVSAGPAADQELSGDAKDAYDRGFQAWAAGDLAGAKAAFTDAASRAPKAGSPRYSLGCVLERLGDTQGALDAYRAAYTANSKYEIAAGAYALLQARTGHGSDAEQFLSDKSAQHPDSVRLMAYLAEVKSIEGDSPGCQQLAQQALAKQPDFKDAMVVIARDYYRGHKWDLAKYALQAILDGADDGSIPPRDKGNADALLLRGLIEREQGERKQALADFDQAASKRPDLFEAYVNLGEMKLEAGNATEAQAPLEKAVRYAPNVAVAHLDLGDCYRLLGRPGDAKSQFDKATALDSTLAGVHYDLGLLYLFSPNVPGFSSPDSQLAKAIQELETYKSMRGAKASRGPGDDVDELLSTAKRKQGELKMKQQAAAAAPAGSAAPAASAGAAPATSAAAAPAASAAAAPPPAQGTAKGGSPAPAGSAASGSSSGGNIVRDLPK
jgi:tetratricopeptide (TPR) repeat protein